MAISFHQGSKSKYESRNIFLNHFFQKVNIPWEIVIVGIQSIVLAKKVFVLRKSRYKPQFCQIQSMRVRVPGTYFRKDLSNKLIQLNVSTETLVEEVHSVVLETDDSEPQQKSHLCASF